MKTKILKPMFVLFAITFFGTLSNAAPVLDGHQRFGLKLTQGILDDNSNATNIFISPLSASMALDMVLNGAHSETRDKMLSTLELDPYSLKEINQANASFVTDLLAKSNAKRAEIKAQQDSIGSKVFPDPLTLNIANAVWTKKGSIKLVPSFEKLLTASFAKGGYEADLTQFDLTNLDDSVSQINDWASKKTNGKINDIVTPQVLSSLELLLANAVYFKASWDKPFEKSMTKSQKFSLEDGSKSSVEMMSETEYLSYTETNEYQAVRLPYAGDLVALDLVLPKENAAKSLNEFYKNNAAALKFWENLDANYSSERVALQLPKFKFKYEAPLTNVLKSLGMEVAFSDDADFSGISKSTALKIGYVKQNSFIDLNEEGTEAAAVTTVGFFETSVRVEPNPIEMKVDRPFLFAIRDLESGSFLFLGLIHSPEIK